MTQYDDFGRPIYESAEEYNRARRASMGINILDGASENISKQSAASRHATREASKRLMLGIVGTAIFVSVMISVTVAAMVGLSNGGSFEQEVTNEITEYLGDTDTPLPAGFEAFSYNGHDYILPTTFEEIQKLGLGAEENYFDDILVPEYEEIIYLYGNDGLTDIEIRVSNHTDSNISIEKSTVDYFYIDNPEIYYEDGVVPDFEFGDGLTFDSTYEEVEAYFGTPYFHYGDYSDGDYDTYEWAYYGEEEVHYISISFLDGTMESVSIEKKILEEKMTAFH